MGELQQQQLMEILLRLRHLEGADPPFDALQITAVQFVYIDKLHKVGPCSLQMLSQELDLTPPTVSVMLKGLEQKALVTRQRDETDGRSYIFKLTKKGQSVFMKVDRFRRDKVANILNHLKDAEQEQLLMLLDKATKTDLLKER